MQQRMALSASNPSSGIIEAFNIAHASVVDQMSNNSLIPAAFNPQVDEVRRIKQQASPPQQRDLLVLVAVLSMSWYLLQL